MDEKMEESQSEERQEKIEENMLDISFNHEGRQYKGWTKRAGNGWHVVLNGVFFGDLTYSDGEWTTSSQRDRSLVEAVGKQLERLQ